MEFSGLSRLCFVIVHLVMLADGIRSEKLLNTEDSKFEIRRGNGNNKYATIVPSPPAATTVAASPPAAATAAARPPAATTSAASPPAAATAAARPPAAATAAASPLAAATAAASPPAATTAAARPPAAATAAASPPAAATAAASPPAAATAAARPPAATTAAASPTAGTGSQSSSEASVSTDDNDGTSSDSLGGGGRCQGENNHRCGCNEHCVNGSCVCLPGFHRENGTCVPIVCQPCPEGTVQIDGKCYGRLVGQPCNTSIDTCIDDNAGCNGTVCNCLPGFHWNGSLCVGSRLCDPCHQSPDSCSAPGFVCGDTTNRCECPSGQVQIGDKCYAPMCGACSTASDCLGSHTVCIAGSCKCQTGYYLNNCGLCLPQKNVSAICTCDEECLSQFCICGVCQPNGTDDPCDDCSQEIADLVIILDASGSVLSANYQLERAFAISLIDSFTISITDTKAAVIDFATTVSTTNTFNLNAYTSEVAITNKIMGFPYSQGYTRTDLALYWAADVTLIPANGDRVNVPNFVVVVTDGLSNSGSQTVAAANYLKSKPDTTVLAVGIAGYNLAELQTIASSPSYVYTAPNFNGLAQIITDIQQIICGG